MVQEQTAAVAAEQPVPVEEQPIAAPIDGQAAAVADAGAVPSIAFESDEDVLKFLEEHPRAKGLYEKRFLDGENTGKQRRDRELRLERGTEDTARAWQEHLATKYGIELDEADRRDAPLWVKANRDRERHDYWRSQSEQVLDAFDVAERERITAAFEQFDGLPEQTEAIARQVIDTAVGRQVDRRLADLTLDGIPKESKLWESVQQHVKSEVEKEFQAREAEREPVQPPPRTPVGAVGRSRTQADYAGQTPEQIAALPEDEYRIAMGFAR